MNVTLYPFELSDVTLSTVLVFSENVVMNLLILGIDSHSHSLSDLSELSWDILLSIYKFENSSFAIWTTCL